MTARAPFGSTDGHAGDRVLDDPAFRRYFVLRTLAMAGGVLSLVAFPVLVYQLTGRASLTALMAVAESLPYLIVGMPAGALVDRWHRRRVMVLTGLVSGASMLTIPAAVLLGSLTFPHVLAVGTAVATLWVFADAAAFGVLPQMVGRGRVASATSALVTCSTVIGLGGPVVTGVLVSATSPALAIGIDGLVHLAVAAGMTRLRWPGSEQSGGTTEGSRLRSEMAEGLRYIWDHPVVRWLTVLGAGASLAGGAVTGLLVVIGVEQLGLADDDPGLGWLYAAAAVGTLVASVSLPRVQQRFGVGLITTTGYAAMLVTLLLLSLTTSIGPGLVVLAVFDLAFTMVAVNGIVTRQVVTPDHLQSRVNTTARLIAWGGNPLGAGLAGVLTDVWGTPWALRVAAGGLLVSLGTALLVGVPRYPRLSELTGDPDDLGKGVG